MKKLFDVLLVISGIVCSQAALADTPHIYLSMVNNSSYQTKVTEGFVWSSTWYLHPGESQDSWYVFTGINNLHLYYQEQGSSQWSPMPGCTPRWWYDHPITVTFEDFKSNDATYPVCRIRLH